MSESRVETFLEAAMTEEKETNLPKPRSRVEKLLNRMAENGVGGGSGSSADIDVTAEVGQTIIVEEVDANGKPTKWKAADYQKKICGDELGYIIPETTIEGSGIETTVDELLVEGETYVVNWEGVDYTCVCTAHTQDGMTIQLIGNTLWVGGEDTGEPFAIGTTLADGNKVGIIVSIDDTVTSFTFSLKEKKAVPIPAQYLTNAFPYYIEITGSGAYDDPYVCNETVAEVEALFDSGRTVYVRNRIYVDGSLLFEACYTFCDRVKETENGYTLGFMKVQNVRNQPVLRLTLYPQSDGSYTIELKVMA